MYNMTDVSHNIDVLSKHFSNNNYQTLTVSEGRLFTRSLLGRVCRVAAVIASIAIGFINPKVLVFVPFVYKAVYWQNEEYKDIADVAHRSLYTGQLMIYLMGKGTEENLELKKLERIQREVSKKFGGESSREHPIKDECVEEAHAFLFEQRLKAYHDEKTELQECLFNRQEKITAKFGKPSLLLKGQFQLKQAGKAVISKLMNIGTSAKQQANRENIFQALFAASGWVIGEEQTIAIKVASEEVVGAIKDGEIALNRVRRMAAAVGVFCLSQARGLISSDVAESMRTSEQAAKLHA